MLPLRNVMVLFLKYTTHCKPGIWTLVCSFSWFGSLCTSEENFMQQHDTFVFVPFLFDLDNVPGHGRSSVQKRLNGYFLGWANREPDFITNSHPSVLDHTNDLVPKWKQIPAAAFNCLETEEWRGWNILLSKYFWHEDMLEKKKQQNSQKPIC